MEELNMRDPIGTILPSARLDARAARLEDRQFQDATARADRELAHCSKRLVHGRSGALDEVRYYRTPTQFTVVRMGGTDKPGDPRKWFETRADGYDWPVCLSAVQP